MQFLKANTQVDVRIGPFVDVGDGFTPETGITLGAADEAELLKHNGAATVDISGRTWAAVTGCDGWYDLTLTTTDTNTEGLLEVVVQDDSVCLPVHARFMVLAEAAYDSMFTAKDTGYMDVNVKAVSEDTTAADDLELFIEALGTDDKVLISTDAQDLNATLHVDAKAISGSTVAADNVEANIGNLDAPVSTVDTVVDAIKAVTDNLPDSGALTTIDGIVDAILVDTGTTLPATLSTIEGYVDCLPASLNDPSAADIADAVWDEASAGHTDAGKAGQQLWTDIDAILVDTAEIGAAGAGLTAVPWNAAWDAEVQSECADALTAYDPPTKAELDTAESNIRGADSDDLKALSDQIDGISAAAIADAVWDEASAGHTDAGKAGAQLWTDIDAILVDTGTTLDGKLNTIDGIVDAILVDTGTTLPGTLTTIEGKVDTVDTVVDAIKAVTDNLPNSGALTDIDTGVNAIEAKLPSKSYLAGSADADGGIDATEAAVINAEVDTALADIDLDHLIQVSAGAEEPTDGSYLDQIMHKDGGQTFDASTDSLEAIRDNQAGADAGAIADAVWDEAASGHTGAGSFGKYVADILEDTGTTLDGIVDAILVDTAEIGAAGAGLTAIPWNAAWDAEVQSEVADGLAAYDPPTKAELDSGLAALNDPTAAAIADAVWDEATTGHVGAGSFGEQVKTDIDAILVDTGTTLPASLATIDGNVDAILVDTGTTLPATLSTIEGKVDTVDGVVDSILTDTGELQTDLTDGGRLDLLIDAIKAKTDNLPADPADDSDIDTQLAAIVADTNELQTDLADGGRLDLLIDAIKAKTDNLPWSPKKNVALSNFMFTMVLSSDGQTMATGKTVTAQISKDGAAFAACTNSVSEVSNGWYKINLTQTEMNADAISLRFSETDCLDTNIAMRTTT